MASSTNSANFVKTGQVDLEIIGQKEIIKNTLKTTA